MRGSGSLLWGLALLSLGACQKAATQAQMDALAPQAKEFPNVGFIEADSGVCTGTLLTAQWVLTAAHCVDEKPVKDYRFTLDPTTVTGTPLFTPSENVVIHPEYHIKLETPGVDVALVHMVTPVPHYVVEKKMALAQDGLSSLKNYALLNVGYGENFDDPGGYRRIKDLKFSEYFELPAKTLKIAEGGISITRGKTNELGCSGDSGSPLVLHQPSGFTILGVYSTSESKHVVKFPEKHDCKIGDTHGNYIATKAFVDWVKKTIAEN